MVVDLSNDQLTIQQQLDALHDDLHRVRKCSLISNALQFDATDEHLIEVTVAAKVLFEGAIYKLAVNDDIIPVGTVTNALFNVYAIMMDLSTPGTPAYITIMGTEAATLAGVVMPVVPADHVLLGMMEINPTGTGDFVGGTDDIDDATIVPNAVFYNTPYPCDLLPNATRSDE